jgi:DNA-binding CsgD family transcriptional regulator
VSGDEDVLFEWPRVTRAAPAGLTQAEREVASLLLAGLSNAEIALRRATSPRTVANQVASLFRKLGLGSRHELFAAAGARRSGGGGDP